MRKYRPQSWSAQAREKGDNAIYNIMSEPHKVMAEFFDPVNGYRDVEMWSNSIAYNMHNISNSYRPAIIRNRAAKRVRRFVRKHGITA